MEIGLTGRYWSLPMSDPILVLSRGLLLLLAPVMLLSPLVFVLLYPKRVESDAQKLLARTRLFWLGIATAGAFAIWIACLAGSLVAPQNPFFRFHHLASFFFFPLWFALGMPACTARNPNAFKPLFPSQAPTRTASLVNRQSQNPIRKSYWILTASVQALLLFGIFGRCFFPFSTGKSLSDELVRWILSLAIFTTTVLFTLLFLPAGIRSILEEPEPLDPHGSAELQRLYQENRTSKIRGLFWLLGCANPWLMGILLLAQAYAWPGLGSSLGVLGAIGGTVLGFTGAWLGTAATFRAMRVAELKAKLDAQAGQQSSQVQQS